MSSNTGGTINFSDALAGQTITLLSGPLTLGKNVTIDASAAPGLAISGNNAVRVFEVNAGTTATVKYLTVKNGYGFQLGGGIYHQPGAQEGVGHHQNQPERGAELMRDIGDELGA